MGRVKGEKKKKDPNQPKRPTSAYFYFVAKQREELNKMGKKITRVAEWTKEVSVKWRALTEKERIPFDKLAATDKARYTDAMRIFKGKDENKPKRAQSAYFLWLADFRIQMKDTKIENKELLRQAGASWKKLTPEQKAPYEKRAEEGRRKYEVAMKEYHANGGANPKVAPKKAVVPVVADNGAAADDDEEEEESEEEGSEEEEEDDE